MPVKVMLDTNVFDILDLDCDFVRLCKMAQASGKVKIYTSYVQIAEIRKIQGSQEKDAKQQRLLKVMDDLDIGKLFPVAKVGFNTTKHGYDMGIVGESKVTFAASPLDELAKEPSIAHPIGENGPDLLTLRCAHDDGMDYLVTQNIADFQKGLKILQEREGTKLKLIDISKLQTLLNDGFE